MTTRELRQRERLNMYLEAEKAILSGQSYTIGNRTLTRADLAAVQKEIDKLFDAGVTLGDDDVTAAASSKRVVLLD